MICPNDNHPMSLEDVEVSPARQQGGEIVDAQYQKMWVCDECDTIIDPVTEEVL